MSQLGEQMRHAREEQGLSLAQASIETRILQQALIAIEAGAFEHLSSDVVARGFIRNYAHYLGLSPEAMIELYRCERGATQRIRIIPTATAPRTRSYVLPSFFAVFFVTMALIGLTYVVLNTLGILGKQTALAPAVVATVSIPTPTNLPTSIPISPVPSQSVATAAGGVTPFQPEFPLPTPEPTPTLAAPIVVELAVNAGGEGSWMRIRVDGVQVFERIMQAGERQVFLAQRDFFVRAGNPTVVEVNVNGMQQGTIGAVPGRPAEWVWPPR